MDARDPSFPSAYRKLFEPITDWMLEAVHKNAPKGELLTECIRSLPAGPLRTVAVVTYINDVIARDNLSGWCLEDYSGLGRFAVTHFGDIGATFHAQLFERLFCKYPFLALDESVPTEERESFADRADTPGCQEAADENEFLDSYFTRFEELAECLGHYINVHFDESL